MVKWSDRQEAIFDEYERTRNNIVICATAGSSKTTCIVECARRTPRHKKALFMAFNKSIAEELRERLPQHIKVNTYHAQGLNVLYSNFRFQMKLNENKTFIIAKSILDLKEIPYKTQLKYLFDLQTIWTSLRVGLFVNYEEDIPNICIDKDIEYQDRMIEDIKLIESEWVRQANKIQNNKNFIMDFTDVNANKIKELEEFIPSEEALQTHLQIQKIKVQKDENYKPEPLYLTIKKSIFNTIIAKVVFKGGQGVDRERIPLVFQYPALPICIIQPTIED